MGYSKNNGCEGKQLYLDSIKMNNIAMRLKYLSTHYVFFGKNLLSFVKYCLVKYLPLTNSLVINKCR